MAEEKKPEEKPEVVDDATLVQDDPVAADEKINEELVANVTKMLSDEPEEKKEVSDVEAPETDQTETPSEAKEPEDETPVLSDKLVARAEEAGLDKDLAEKLHQSGQLEETLAAIDRAMIERFQSKETEEKPVKREEKPPKQEVDLEDLPELDPEVYDEALVKRDAYLTQQVQTLQSQVSELLEQQQAALDQQFDNMVDEWNRPDLFGKGDHIPKSKREAREQVIRAYDSACELFGRDPRDFDPDMAERAFAFVFPKEDFKQETENKQKKVERARDAEGKFLSSSNSAGLPPGKTVTEEDAHDDLVSNVTAYLKKQGVQMSGV